MLQNPSNFICKTDREGAQAAEGNVAILPCGSSVIVSCARVSHIPTRGAYYTHTMFSDRIIEAIVCPPIRRLVDKG